MSDSMEAYMKSIGVHQSDRDAILRSARHDYNSRLKPQYVANYNDILLGITKAKTDLFSCFADVNEDIGLIAATTRLKDFLSTHKVEYDFYKEDSSNKLDMLEKQS
ncbi:MAG: hypothetical protein MJ233_05620 [Mycoplasmoidaceae bacterium]|nr:hypothetical protein [Mycoplasmoidaceae bacterium]